MSRQEPYPALKARDDETIESHGAFVLFCALNPQVRSNRRVSILLGIAESSVRHYRRKRDWDARIAEMGESTKVERAAAAIFARDYHTRILRKPTAELQTFLRVEYTPPAPGRKGAETPPSRLPPARLSTHPDEVRARQAAARAASPPPAKPPPADPATADDASEDEGAVEDPDVGPAPPHRSQKERAAETVLADPDRLGRLLRITETRLLQRIVNGNIKLGIGDLEKVMRIRDRLETERRKRLLEEQGTSSSGGTTESVAKSERVLRAATEGGDVLAAIQDDLGELSLIVSTLRDAESNVVPLARAREGGG